MIDGKANEWDDSLFFLDPDSRIRYAVVNDSNNLYLCLKVFDDYQQMKLLRGGLEVWVDPAGKKHEVCGIRFPLSTTLNPGNKTGWNPGDPSWIKKIKLLYLLQAKDMELTGFKEGINGLRSNVTNNTGVQNVLKLDSTNILIYEVKIPFTNFKTDVAKAIPLSVGFIIKGLERPKMQDGQDSHGNGMENREGGGEMGNRYGGEGRGGHSHQDANRNEEGGSGRNPRQIMFEDTSIWFKLSIAH